MTEQTLFDMETPRAADACEHTWGNCDKENPANAIYWGKPSATPHLCGGKATHVRRAIGKLHVCETCKCMGGRTQPSPYTKAGAQLRRAIMQSEGLSK